MTKSLISAVACVAIATFFATNASAQQHLFSQYSTSGANNVNASLYPAPHPVPGYVGSSAYTYQPLMPHEMMYTHSRNYITQSGGPEQYYRDPYGAPAYPGGSHLNVTKVRWQSGVMGYAGLPSGGGLLGQLKYKAAVHRYRVPASHAYGGGGGLFGGGAGGGLFSGGCLSGRCSRAGAGVTAGDDFSYSGSEYTEPSFTEPAYAEPIYSEPIYSEPAPTGGCAACAANLSNRTTTTK